MTLGQTLRHALEDVRVRELLEAWCEPYDWAQGAPPTAWLNGPHGYDCSGFAQAALVHLGLLSRSAKDRGAHQLAMAAMPVPEGEERLGDLAFYGGASHVMVVLAPGIVLGAAGGDSSTHGDKPSAYVDLRPLRYRRDFLCLGRLAETDVPDPDPTLPIRQ
jgi:cell wall-associated NlpC family hydrolase